MKTIQLTLTLDEVNQILDALGQQSYIQVYQLIASIQRQANDQLRVPYDEPPMPSPDAGGDPE